MRKICARVEAEGWGVTHRAAVVVASTTLMVAALALPIAATADETESIVAAHVEALGGRERIAAIESLRKLGTYVYNGLEHPVVVVQKRGAGCREDIEGLTTWGTANAQGTTVIRAWDGKNVWEGSQGDELETRQMEPAEAVGFVLDAEIDNSLVAAADREHRVALVGPADVDGVATIQLAVTRSDDVVEHWFLDAETHLAVMRSTEVPDGEFKAAQKWFFDDYRDVAGVQMPFYVLIEERLFSREYIFDEIQTNIALADSDFAQPPGTEAPEGE